MIEKIAKSGREEDRRHRPCSRMNPTNGVRVVIDLKRVADCRGVMNQLYRLHQTMQTYFRPGNMLA